MSLEILVPAELMRAVRARARREGYTEATQLRQALHDALHDALKPIAVALDVNAHKPFIIMLAGVNGSGKTTSIGKLAHYYQGRGKSVLLAAGGLVDGPDAEPLRYGKRAFLNRAFVAKGLIALRRDVRALVGEDESPFAFDPSWTLVAGRLPAHGDGAPVIVDSYGAMLLSAVQDGAHVGDAATAFAINRTRSARRRLRPHSAHSGG